MPQAERIGDNFIVRDVPIFDAHEDSTRHPNLRRVDESTLATMLRRAEARLMTEGELPVAFDVRQKHTPAPGEKHAPPAVKGGYRNLRIDDFGPDGNRRKALYADVRIPAEHWKEAQGFQRRSLEVFTDTLEPDTLVMLGSVAPARDLGPLTPIAQYSRDGRSVERYEMAGGLTPAEPATEPAQESQRMLSPEDIEALRGVIREELQSVIAEQGEDPAGEPNAEPEQPLPEEPAAPNADAGLAVDESKRKEAEAYARLRAEDARKNSERYERNQRDQDARIKALERERDTERYTRALSDLQNEGVIMDRATELADLLDMTEPQREKHLKRISEQYSRDVTGAPSIAEHAQRQERYERRPTGATAGGAGALTPQQAAAAYRKAVEAGGKWEDAVKAVTAAA